MMQRWTCASQRHPAGLGKWHLQELAGASIEPACTQLRVIAPRLPIIGCRLVLQEKTTTIVVQATPPRSSLSVILWQLKMLPLPVSARPTSTDGVRLVVNVCIALHRAFCVAVVSRRHSLTMASTFSHGRAYGF